MQDEPIKTDRRNASGVKDSSDQYRTFNGEHYSCFLFAYMEDYLSEVAGFLRKRGIKCRRLGEDLYVRHADFDKACALMDDPAYPDPDAPRNGTPTP